MGKDARENFSSVRHLAYQILAQLPEDEREAIRILEYARQILLHPIEEQAHNPIVMKLVESASD